MTENQTQPLRLRHDRNFQIVVAVSAAVTAFGAAYLWTNPPLDGDSYEYAGVARNFLETGRLDAIHISGHFLTEQALPHPAWNRATLWTFVLMPFHWLFGGSYWTFAVPNLLSFFLIGPVTYVVGRAFFPAAVALAAAVATALNPRLLWWATVEDPGHPDTLAVVLFLLAIHLMARRRWLWAGAMGGFTLLLRLNSIVLLPTLAVWLLGWSRPALRTRGPYLYVLLFALCASPHFIRTALAFDGNPFYSDQFASQRGKGKKAVAIAKNNSALEIMFRYEDPNEPREPETLRDRAEFAYYTGQTVLFGTSNEVSWYPGFFETITLLLSPLFLIGMWGGRRNPAKALMSVFVLGNLALTALLKMGYEDRYIFAVIPFCMLLAFDGGVILTKRWPRLKLTPVRVMAVFVLLEAVPAIGLKTFALGESAPRAQYEELKAVCAWMQTELPREAVYMTTPFWSPQYLCERKTVPPVLGGLDVFKRVVDQYRIDYFLFSEYWGGDRFPRFTFMQPLLRGGHLTLYRIERNHPDYLDRSRYAYMRDFDSLGYFWKHRFDFRVDPPPQYFLYSVTGDVAFGGVLFVLVCIGAWALAGLPDWRWRWAGYAAAGVALLASKVVSLVPLRDATQPRPPFSRYQIEHWLDSAAGARIGTIHLVTGAGTEEGLLNSFPARGRAVDTAGDLFPPSATNDIAYFAPVSVGTGAFANLESAQANAITVATEESRMQGITQRFMAAGYDAEPVEGGVIGWRSGPGTAARGDGNEQR